MAISGLVQVPYILLKSLSYFRCEMFSPITTTSVPTTTTLLRFNIVDFNSLSLHGLHGLGSAAASAAPSKSIGSATTVPTTTTLLWLYSIGRFTWLYFIIGYTCVIYMLFTSGHVLNIRSSLMWNYKRNIINIEFYTMCSGIVGCLGKDTEREGEKQSQESERLEASHVLFSLL